MNFYRIVPHNAIAHLPRCYGIRPFEDQQNGYVLMESFVDECCSPEMFLDRKQLQEVLLLFEKSKKCPF